MMASTLGIKDICNISFDARVMIILFLFAKKNHPINLMIQFNWDCLQSRYKFNKIVFYVMQIKNLVFSHAQNETYLPTATFILKTYSILSLPENVSIIAWNPEGDTFVIKDVKLFVSLVLPKHFRHRKYESFIRQLNMYNFSKIKNQEKPSFYNQFFKREREDLLKYIHRKPEKKKRQADDLLFSNFDKIVEKNSLEEFVQQSRQNNIIIIPLQTDLKNIEKQPQKKRIRKITFRENMDLDAEQNFSTLIKPSSKWISRDDSCWQQINFSSFKISMKLLEDRQESVHSLKCLLAEPSKQKRPSCNLLQPCTLKNID